MVEDHRTTQIAEGNYIAQADRGSNASVTVIQHVTSLSISEQRNRHRMLEKVYSFWIKGVLENSLHGIALVDLGMEYRPDAVAYPWEMVLQKPDIPTRLLRSDTKIVDVFDEQNGELLKWTLLSRQ